MGLVLFAYFLDVQIYILYLILHSNYKIVYRNILLGVFFRMSSCCCIHHFPLFSQYGHFSFFLFRLVSYFFFLFFVWYLFRYFFRLIVISFRCCFFGFFCFFILYFCGIIFFCYLGFLILLIFIKAFEMSIFVKFANVFYHKMFVRFITEPIHSLVLSRSPIRYIGDLVIGVFFL